MEGVCGGVHARGVNCETIRIRGAAQGVLWRGCTEGVWRGSMEGLHKKFAQSGLTFLGKRGCPCFD